MIHLYADKRIKQYITGVTEYLHKHFEASGSIVPDGTRSLKLMPAQNKVEPTIKIVVDSKLMTFKVC